MRTGEGEGAHTCVLGETVGGGREEKGGCDGEGGGGCELHCGGGLVRELRVICILSYLIFWGNDRFRSCSLYSRRMY